MKKFLCSLAILSIVLGIASVAMAKSFSDVKSTEYGGSIDILSELKIVDGYDDGTYKPTKAVKRSEMAKLIIIALGEDESATLLKGTTNFKDVGASHWASGYINMSSELGIIKGYPDGSFKPDDTVSYVEAVTMLLRALKYDKELDNLSWPTGYMTKGNSAGILDGVTGKNSSEDAIRGNVALMVLNTLKGYTRKISATTGNGVQYGNDKILLEKTFKDLVYVEEGQVIDIDLENETLIVEDKNNNRDVEILYTDSNNIKKMFGRKLTFIYDKDVEDFYSFKTIDKLTVDFVDVDTIDEAEDILVDIDGEEYDLPKSENILMLGATRYEDIEKAYITYDEKDKIVYMTLVGNEKIYVGVITDKEIDIDGKKGIEIVNPSDKYEELVLANSSVKRYVNDVVVYTYNNDNKIVIKTLKDVTDAKTIDSVSKTSIKLKGENKITFSSTSDYKLFLIEEGYLEAKSLSDVDAQYDKAVILEYGEISYILVFMNAVDEEDIVSDVSVSTARKSLNTAITNAKKKISKESSYSVVTMEKLKDAVDYGERIYAAASSYSSAKIQLATRDINDAMSALKTATTADKELRAAFKTLEDKIKEAEALTAADYTTTSWTALNTVLTEAKKIVIEKTTKEKVTTAVNNITSKMNLLVTNASAEQITEALARLDTAIADAEAKRASDYSSASYELLTDALATAKKLDRTNAGAREIKNIASNLEAALDDLVQANLPAYETAREKLDTAMEAAKANVENEYTPTSWNVYINLLDDVETEYDALKDIDDVKALANSAIPAEKDKVEAVYTALNNALKKLVLKTEATARNNSINTINKCIAKFETYTETTWAETDPVKSYTDMKAKVDDAKEAVDNDATTTEELKAIANDLTQYIVI